MKKLFFVLLALGTLTAFASENCTMAFPRKSTAKQLKIIAKKFNLKTKGFEFKIGKVSTSCEWTNVGNPFRGESYGTGCTTEIELLDANNSLVTTITGPRGGQVERSVTRALKKLPNCLEGEI